MEMFKHELYKIFSKKSVLIALAVFTVLSFLTFFTQVYYTKYTFDEKSKYNIYQNYEGNITKEKVDTVRKKVRSLNGIQNKSIKEQIEYDTYSRIAMSGSLMDQYKMKLKEVRNNIQNTSGFERKQNEMLYNIMIKAGEPKIYYTAGWDFIDDFSSRSYIAAAMILIGLAAVFSGEYSSGMDSVIQCSKNGKKGIVSAKIFASIFYIITVDIFFLAMNFIFNAVIYGIKGWNAPIQCLMKFMNSPYAFTVLQYYAIGVGIHIIGCITFGTIVLLISSLSKNSFTPFSICGLIFLVPLIISSVIKIKSPFSETIINFSITWVMQVEKLFQLYKVYNVFGHPILYPVLVLIFAVLLIILSQYYIYKSFREHQTYYV